MRSVLGKALMLGLAVAATSIAACSGGAKPSTSGQSTGATGDIGLQLQVGGTTITSVHYVIDNGTNHYEGDLDVADASHLLAVIGGIQAGSNYVLTLTGYNGSTLLPCSGQSTPFTVVANSTVIVGIQLLCRQGSDAGSVKIEGTVAECANLGGVSAAVPNGNTIQITTSTIPASPVPPVTFSWAGDVAGLSATNVPNPVYTCNNSGTTDQQINLDLTISQGTTTTCNKTFHLIIDCPPGTNGTTGGTGGSAGTGGTGGSTGGTAGTGGTGGSTGGTAGTGGTGGSTGGTAGTGGSTGGTAGTGGTDGGAVCAPNTPCNQYVTDSLGTPGDTCDNGITGNAPTGPATGTPWNSLCNEALLCIHQSNCDSLAGGNGITDCYCGSLIGSQCNAALPTATNAGPCFNQFNRAFGQPSTETGAYVLNLINQTDTGGGLATYIATVEHSNPNVCRPYCR